METVTLSLDEFAAVTGEHPRLIGLQGGFIGLTEDLEFFIGDDLSLEDDTIVVCFTDDLAHMLPCGYNNLEDELMKLAASGVFDSELTEQIADELGGGILLEWD